LPSDAARLMLDIAPGIDDPPLSKRGGSTSGADGADGGTAPGGVADGGVTAGGLADGPTGIISCARHTEDNAAMKTADVIQARPLPAVDHFDLCSFM